MINQFILSPKADLKEAGKNLFTGLRWLDSLDIYIIYAELVPDTGIGKAINDRLKRAASKALDNKGRAWTWGANTYYTSGGQLGDGTTVSKDYPVSVLGGKTFSLY